ncbi:MAG: tyrosine-type recombinase/integrase [Deltaproteobacteria bacterium]|nr:tyrosine-type recombinase/integrase [Deltaproteobacteria bacterium]
MPVYRKKENYYCVYLDGKKRIWEPFGKGPSARKKAETRDLEIKYLKARGKKKVRRENESITFTELAQLYINSRFDLADTTLNDIGRIMAKYFLPRIGETPISLITIEDALEIESDMLEKGLTARTINKNFQYAKHIFKWAVWSLDGQLADNPWSQRISRRQKKHHIEIFTIREYINILNAADKHLKWALELEYYTGMRPGRTELFAARWDHIDWKQNRIKIYGRKTDEWRWQYLTPDFMERLRRRYESRECEHIVSFRGKQIKSNLSRSWKAAKQTAEISRTFRLYDIRHFYITYALAMGADIAELAERVGNSPETIIKHYLHLARELQKKEAHQIPDLFAEIDRIEAEKNGECRKKCRKGRPALRLVKG